MFKLVFVYFALAAGNPPHANPVAKFEVDAPFGTEAACVAAAESKEAKAYATEVGKTIMEKYGDKIKIAAVGTACKKVDDVKEDDKITDPSGDRL